MTIVTVVTPKSTATRSMRIVLTMMENTVIITGQTLMID